MYLPDWLRPELFLLRLLLSLYLIRLLSNVLFNDSHLLHPSFPNIFIIIAFVSLFNIFAPWLVSVFATIFSFAASICIISELIPLNVDREKAFLKQKHSIGHEYLLILM